MGTAHKITDLYLGSNGLTTDHTNALKIKGVYIGKNNVAKKIISIYGGATFDMNTMLLLHGEQLVDSSKNNIPIINVGNVQISAAQSKFGGKSLYFDGESRLQIETANLGIDINSDWTFDWWEYPQDTDISMGVFYIKGIAPTNGFLIGSPANGKTRILAGESKWDFIPPTSIGNHVENQWVHRAVCKSGETVYGFENGKLFVTKTISGSFSMKDILTIGYRDTSSGFGGFKGYIDEIRISDIARWVADFSVPTEPY